MKIMSYVLSLFFVTCFLGCDAVDETSDYGGDSGGGTALPYGGGTYSWTCNSGSTGSLTIPHTSTSSCVTVYQDYARIFGCNYTDEFSSAQSGYENCLALDVAACASASSSDPNC